jgi:HAD superfamily phosphatase
MKPLLAFDMDGVLVDVTDSYRETIAQTAEYFIGRPVTKQEIQEYKNQGGWNDDWKLTHHIVREADVDVAFEEVQSHFQKLFRGPSPAAGQRTALPHDALMLRERWVARPGVLEDLQREFNFAIFTGRPREEAALTLARFADGLTFDPIVAMEDTPNHKPAPDGLLRILKQHCDCKVFYIGDTVDDARCARAANVPFIGITAPSNPTYLDLVFLFQAERAYAIVDDINYLAEVFSS